MYIVFMCGGLVGDMAPGASATFNSCNYLKKTLNRKNTQHADVHCNTVAIHIIIEILFYDQSLHQ